MSRNRLLVQIHLGFRTIPAFTAEFQGARVAGVAAGCDVAKSTQSSGQVFRSAWHHDVFRLVGTSVAGTLQHGMMVVFWADAKLERAATATKTVVDSMVN